MITPALHKFALSRNPELHEFITVIGQILDARCWILDKQKRSDGGIRNIQHPESRNQDQLRSTAAFPIITSYQNIKFMQLWR